MRKITFISLLVCGMSLVSCEASFAPPEKSTINNPAAPKWYYLTNAASAISLQGILEQEDYRDIYPSSMKIVVAWEVPDSGHLYVYGHGTLGAKISDGKSGWIYPLVININKDTLPASVLLQSSDSNDAIAIAHIFATTNPNLNDGAIIDTEASAWNSASIVGIIERHVIGFTKGDLTKFGLRNNGIPINPHFDLYQEFMFPTPALSKDPNTMNMHLHIHHDNRDIKPTVFFWLP